MKMGRRSCSKGYVAILLNINAAEARQKALPFPLGSIDFKKLA
jgi:hypothetical protein